MSAINVYAFDVNDTLEISGGPVKMEWLQMLHDQGHVVGICGNFALVTRWVIGWHRYINFIGQMHMTKRQFLGQIRSYVPAETYILIGNSEPGNLREAIAARWGFIEAVDFAKSAMTGFANVPVIYGEDALGKNQEKPLIITP